MLVGDERLGNNEGGAKGRKEVIGEGRRSKVSGVKDAGGFYLVEYGSVRLQEKEGVVRGKGVLGSDECKAEGWCRVKGGGQGGSQDGG